MKLAIICTGGGMRCAYSGGALNALAKEYGITDPHIAIGISGGAGSVAYYLSKQYDGMERIWTELLPSKDFISFSWRNPILKIDYLIDTVFRDIVPFDIEKFKNSTTEWLFPVTDLRTKKENHFFSKNDKLDIFELLRACMAVPVVYGREVILGKIGYRDGDMGLSVSDAIEKAKSCGATDILIIENHLEDIRVRFVDRYIQKKIFGHVVRENHTHEDTNVTILRLQNIHSPAGFLSRDKKKLRATFDKGYTDITHHPELRTFLSKFQAEPVQPLSST